MNSDRIELTRDYLLRQRQAYLMLVDSIEIMLDIHPRTSELRRAAKTPPPQYYAELEHEKVVTIP